MAWAKRKPVLAGLGALASLLVVVAFAGALLEDDSDTAGAEPASRDEATPVATSVADTSLPRDEPDAPADGPANAGSEAPTAPTVLGGPDDESAPSDDPPPDEAPAVTVPGTPAVTDEEVPDWERLARSVVQVYSEGCDQAGSGIVVGDGGFALTNSHVVRSETDGAVCDVVIGFAQRFEDPPDCWQPAELEADDSARDLAVLRLSAAGLCSAPPLQVERDDLALGAQITILGYPGFGQSQQTLTLTSGTFSGTSVSPAGHRQLKVDALLDSGVSGGAMFDATGRLVGVPTGGYEGEGGTLGIAIPGTEVLEFLAERGLRLLRDDNGDESAAPTTSVATTVLPPVTFPDASVRDPEAEAADLERRRSVIGLFERLRVEAEMRSGYNRDAVFGDWRRSGGKTTRQHVLADEQLPDGSWYSAYDNTVVETASQLDIDHLVPLAEAWDSGGHAWSEDRWKRFGNDLGDPRALIAVSYSTNRSKGARDPGEWWPPNDEYHCQYAVDWIAVKTRWDLAIDTVEQDALEAKLEQCDGDDFAFTAPEPARTNG
ncbi:trypsin-like peptidase domain-containing protein [Candidatus Poriferisodalis sp.]|uniref:trypsin-like peptidase domain-containing protein n=1 Tax=Candidatus Poriferisodalis sp. TaxID=3101277 RepID=UPI003B021617